MGLYQNIISLIAIVLLLPLLLITVSVKIVSAVIIAFVQLLLNKQYDKSKEWKIITMFNNLGDLILN